MTEILKVGDKCKIHENHVRFQNALKINKRPIFLPKGFYCSQNPVKFRWKHFSFTEFEENLLVGSLHEQQPQVTSKENKGDRPTELSTQ